VRDKVDPTMAQTFHMNRGARTRAVTRVALFTACLAIVGSGADSTARAQAAGEEDLNRRGIELRKGGNDAAARGVFQEMYDRFRSPRSAAQLGLAEQAVGRWEDAEAHVSEALRTPSDAWVAKHRAPLDQAIIAIRAHVARVEISGDPVGAEVLINGRSVGKLPLARSITVPIGQVDVECRAPGRKTAVRTLSLGAADYQRVFVRMEKEAGEPALRRARSVSLAHADPPGSAGEPEVPGDKDGAANADSAPEHPAAGAAAGADTARTGPSSVRSAIKWTSLGLAVAGLGTGIAGSIVREQQVSTFRATNNGNCRDNGGRGVDPTGAPVAACQGPLDAQKTATVFQIAGFVGAGVFAVTWLVLQLTEPDTGEHGAATEAQADRAARALAAWQCAPSLFPQSPSVSCAFTF
jgi:hypothetical protein